MNRNAILVQMKKWIISLLLLTTFSCGKEEVTESASSMIGTWVHYSAADAWEKVTITEDGRGKVEWYTNGKLHKETKEKTWYVKDNRLFFGKVTFSINPYDIEAYPVVSGSTTIDGFDTLTQGKRYCILNQLNFVEKG